MGSLVFHRMDSTLAQSPCLCCDKPFHGEARNLYLSIYDHDAAIKFRHVLCADCFDLVLGAWVGRALHRDPRGDWTIPEPAESLDDLWTLLEGPQARYSLRNRLGYR